MDLDQADVGRKAENGSLLRNSIATNQPDFHSNKWRGWAEFGICCMTSSVSYSLSTIEVERFERLKFEFCHNYDKENTEHEAVLTVLYNNAIGSSYFSSGWQKTHEWETIGFGGADPRSDFRAGGLFALLNLVYFVKYYPEQFKQMKEVTCERSDFLIAIVSINVTSRLKTYLHLNEHCQMPDWHYKN